MAEPTIQRRGFLLVLSSPSGAGKTTISRIVVQRDDNLRLSISATTRPPRPGEIEGQHYYFVTRDTFDAMVAEGELLEHAIVFGNCYGTPREPLMAALDAGIDVISDVDWQGTQQLKERARDDLISIFVLPPSREALRERLQNRAQDAADVIQIAHGQIV